MRAEQQVAAGMPLLKALRGQSCPVSWGAGQLPFQRTQKPFHEASGAQGTSASADRMSTAQESSV